MEFDDVSDNDIGENLMDDTAVENAVTQILTAVGEDPHVSRIAWRLHDGPESPYQRRAIRCEI